MGDSLFHVFIQTYYERYKGKNANTDDLEKIAEEISHKNLKQFFTQWLYSPGIPQLNIQWRLDEVNELSVTVIQNQTEVFQFPLQLAIESDAQKERIVTMPITKRTETFKFKVEKKLRHLNIDPNTSLLYDGKLEKLN